ncbi:MAG TPA: rhomboid-like protein [Mycobacteriales bacterium]|nr:rhomboid-like protein [Mycobacteriales bacterium]
MRAWSRFASGRIPIVTAAYAVALFVSNIWLELSAPHTEAHVLYDASTNLHHLTRDPWFVLPASAFFTHAWVMFAVAGVILGVGALERIAGWRAVLVVGITAHVLGTVLSEGIVAIRIAIHDVSPSARHLLDVGPSYVIVGCAAAAIAWPRASRNVQLAAMVALTPLLMLTAVRLPLLKVDAIGHATAALTGVASAMVKRRRGCATAALPAESRPS